MRLGECSRLELAAGGDPWAISAPDAAAARPGDIAGEGVEEAGRFMPTPAAVTGRLEEEGAFERALAPVAEPCPDGPAYAQRQWQCCVWHQMISQAHAWHQRIELACA